MKPTDWNQHRKSASYMPGNIQAPKTTGKLSPNARGAAQRVGKTHVEESGGCNIKAYNDRRISRGKRGR
jgi:hypothetical protein